MRISNLVVGLISRKEAQPIIERWHYSKSINGIMSSFCFGLFYEDLLIGAAIFGKPAMANQYKKYANNADDLLELRRLAIIDETPKNTESFFIGSCLRYLRKNTCIKIILSYADSNYDHSGIIYRASNFEFKGMTSCGRVIIYKDKKYHDKAIRTKYNNKLKPFALELKKALESGEAKYIKQQPKYIYTYKLR